MEKNMVRQYSSGTAKPVAWRWCERPHDVWRVTDIKPFPKAGRLIEPLYLDVAQAGQDERRQARLERSGLDIPEAQTLDDVVAQQPTKPGPDDRPIPTYGQIPWDQLGRDVMDAMYAKRSDYPFDKSYYPGHQMVPQINFNSLARIVDKYRYYALASPPAALPAGENLPTLDEYRNNLIEECAKIAEPWAGFWLSDSSTEADRAVVAVRTEIAAKIRGLAIPSTPRATGPLVPWELKCQREVCAAPECECPAVTSTDLRSGE